MGVCWYEEVCSEYRENCERLCPRYIEMRYLIDHSNLPEKRKTPQKLFPEKCDLIAFTRLDTIRKDIVNFVNEGKNLYICSDVTGNGKTTWAVKLMLRYFDQIWDGNGLRQRALFIHVPTYLLKCKNFSERDYEFEELKKAIYDVDLVVWDDIASTGMSQYDYSSLLVAIEAREMNGKANIITGNHTNRDKLADLLGEKLVSRLWNSQTEIIEFKGGDRR